MDLVVQRVPWVVFDAARWLRDTVKPGWRIFEWGSGGSTTFFLSLGATVATVEHDEAWYDKVREEVNRHPDMCVRWEHFLRPPRPGDAVPSERMPGDFSEYAGVIGNRSELDLVFVDGRARNFCAKLAAPKLKSGGWLVLDNADRADYQPTFDLLETWRVLEFQGHGPLSDVVWKTTAWRKPEA